jgi:predicted dehydrogenase
MRVLILLLLVWPLCGQIRVGIIGTDTSHVPAFTKLLNDANGKNYIPGARVVAAYKGGSKDLESSYTRVEKYAAEIQRDYGVEIVPDIATLCAKVDAVLLESVDGRPHLEQARQVIAHKKPLFIDKPLAASLDDAREIARLAKAAGVPWFSSSSLRWAPIAETKYPDITGVTAWGPGPTEPHHTTEMTWYGIHTVEMVYALLGRGCEEVTMTAAPGADVAVGRWKDGRLGVVRVQRPYGPFGAAIARKEKNQVVQSPADMKSDYVPLVREIVKFFQTKRSPVDPEETLEIFAFMDAAQRSKQAGGRPVKLR